MHPSLFEVAAGSVPGRDHLGRHPTLVGKNNQDAYYWEYTPEGVIALVADGCGSQPHSEVGAKLAVRLLATRLRMLSHCKPFPWKVLQHDFLTQLLGLTRSICGADGNFAQTLCEYFLCTIVGALIDSSTTSIFAVGDGVYQLNPLSQPSTGLKCLGPYAENTPPYIAYNLASSRFTSEELEIKVHESIPTADLHSLLLGTDGVEQLANISDRQIPGLARPVGPLCQFWQEDAYFANPDKVRRTLSLINREVVSFDESSTEPNLRCATGLLRDDTTLLAIRRRTKGEPQ